MKLPKTLLGHRRLFLGAGEKSQAECFELVSMLMSGIDKLNALQQLGLQGDSFDHQEYIDLEHEIELIAASLYFRLTGKVPNGE